MGASAHWNITRKHHDQPVGQLQPAGRLVAQQAESNQPDTLEGSMTESPGDPSLIFIELGASVVGLAILARVAKRLGFSAIPLYLLAGLAFGKGGLLPLGLSSGFVHIGAEIGVLLLLLMLGLESTGEELRNSLISG